MYVSLYGGRVVGCTVGLDECRDVRRSLDSFGVVGETIFGQSLGQPSGGGGDVKCEVDGPPLWWWERRDVRS